MNKNVCLITWPNSVNYGTCIQCYALAEYLRNNNYNVFIPNTNKYYFGIKHPFETLYSIKNKLNNKLFSKNEYKKGLEKEFDTRKKKNTNFVNNNTKVSKIDSKSDYQNIIKKCDYFISGSDQIWNPKYVTPPMLLSMAPKDKIKIAYGSSIGVSEIPKNKIELYRKYLNRFNYIGLREKTAKNALKEIVSKDTEVVLDPSFLLSKKEWERIAIKPTSIKEDTNEFIFSYFIGDTKKNEKEIKSFEAKNKIPIYYAVSESKTIYSFGTALADLSVEEFIWCLLNARYVITDSFHAVALSINFNKNFYVYKRFVDSDNNSQNSRIYDIIETFDLKNNIESQNTELKNIKDKMDFIKINDKLDRLKQSSMRFLSKALGDEYENNL